MSFDVFFQGFVHGEARPSGNRLAHDALAPHLVSGGDGVTAVRIGDGEAELYGLDREGGFMATHITGGPLIWDLLVRAAKAADYVIMAVGCPTCVVEPGQEEHLPEGLGDDVALISDGAALRRTIISA